MSAEIVGAASYSAHRLAIQEHDGSVWLTFCRPWYDLASWLWWALTPGKRAWLLVRREDGRRQRVRAVRLARNVVKMGGSGAS